MKAREAKARMDPGPAGSVSADEAARSLGVSRATLYAYVSRGLVRSQPVAGARERRYSAQDVRALLARREQRRDPAVAAREALHFGGPVLDSELALIDGGNLFYRGHDALALARTATIEEVAGLLWSGDLSAPFPDAGGEPLATAVTTVRRAVANLPPLEAFEALLATASALDPASFDLSPDGVRRTGARIVRLLAACAAGAEPSRRPLAEVLAQGLVPKSRIGPAQRLLDSTLVLWADHELNVSTFVGRCVASALASPYAVIVAGLAALRGIRHGGATEQVEALFDEAVDPERAARTLEARLRRGERFPGFGHPLYPEGDPRARLLLELLHETLPPRAASARESGLARESGPARGSRVTRDAGLPLADALTAAAFSLRGLRPNVDFAVVAVRRTLGMPDHSALAIVAVGRSVGWIAHALEQYGDERLIRPRARYVGPQPELRSAGSGTAGSRGRP